MSEKNSSKEKIMEAAVELFERYGYEKTTLEDIAGRIGKTKTSVYYYFDGKQDILREVLSREFAAVQSKLIETWAKSFEKEPCRFKEYLKARMTLIIGMRVYPQFTVNQYSDSANGVSGIVREVRDVFDRWEKDYFLQVCVKGREIGALKEGVHPEAFSEMLLTLLKGIEIQYFVAKDKAAVLSTYNEMIDYLINDSCERCDAQLPGAGEGQM